MSFLGAIVWKLKILPPPNLLKTRKKSSFNPIDSKTCRNVCERNLYIYTKLGKDRTLFVGVS